MYGEPQSPFMQEPLLHVPLRGCVHREWPLLVHVS